MSRPEVIKSVRALHKKKFRTEQRRFLVQGRKMVAEVLASDLKVEAVYATAEAAKALADPRVVVMPDHDLERMGTFDAGNEVVAVVHMPEHVPMSAMDRGELALALDGVSDPGNLGTVLRVADWFGVRRVLLGESSVEVYNPKCVQASMGAVLRVATYEVDLSATLDRLAKDGATLYFAEMDGENVFRTELVRPAVLVLGSESHGISASVRKLKGVAITIPRSGESESLNVAMAASALCMEFTRRYSSQ